MTTHDQSAALIRPCAAPDLDRLLGLINDSAEAYRNVIPADCFHDPYMTREELESEWAAGVAFSCCESGGTLLGAMGSQPVQDVLLIRHAYVATAARRGGIGGRLLAHILRGVERPVLVGTWAAASWAIAFYRKHGFEVVPASRHAALLRKYWSVPDRQIETSVVLADARAAARIAAG